MYTLHSTKDYRKGLWQYVLNNLLDTVVAKIIRTPVFTSAKNG